MTILTEAVVKLAVPDEWLASIWVVIGAYAGSLALFCAARPLRSALRFKRKLKRFDVHVNSKALLGFLALSFLASIALKALTGSDHYSNFLYGVALLITALVLWRVLAARSLPSYSTLFKIIITLFIAAFALFSSAGTFSGALILLALTAGSLFWFGVIVFAMQVCSSTKRNPIAVLCGIYALLSCQGLFEPLLSGIVPSWGAALDSHLLCSIFVIILTVASLWLLSEKNIDDLLAGSSLPGTTRGNPDADTHSATSAGAEGDVPGSRSAANGEAGSGVASPSSTASGGAADNGAGAATRTAIANNGAIGSGIALQEQTFGTAEGNRGNTPNADATSATPGRISPAIAAQYGLTAKEQQVVGLYAIGRSAPYIAEELIVSVNTVKSHLANAYQKMGIHSRQELISLVSEE